MKYFTKEVKIAIIAIVGVVILFIGLQFLKGLSLFSNSSTYYVKFDDISGLSKSSPVFANGIKVGVVENVDFDYERHGKIIVAVGLDKELAVPRGTSADITSDLLGNVKLELHFGPDVTDKLAAGDTIMGGLQEGLMSKAAAIMPQVEQMLPKLDSILVNINTLLTDPALSGSIHHVEQLTASLTSTSHDLHQLMNSLSKRMPGMLDKADGVLTNTEQLTQKLGELNPAETMAHVNQILANVQQLSQALNNNEGTMGLLLNNPDLYNHLSETMRDVDALLQDFKAHPRRYINVSVFGKKSD